MTALPSLQTRIRHAEHWAQAGQILSRSLGLTDRSEWPAEQLAHTQERLMRVVTGLGQLVRACMPPDLRRKGMAELRINTASNSGVGNWHNSVGNLVVDLETGVKVEAECAEIKSQTFINAVAKELCDGLARGRYQLPGFEPAVQGKDFSSIVWKRRVSAAAKP